jgi:hypothetical protein
MGYGRCDVVLWAGGGSVYESLDLTVAKPVVAALATKWNMQ